MEAAVPEVRLPLTLWISLILVLAAFAYEIASCISMVFMHLSQLSNASSWPEWLRLFSQWLTRKLGYDHMLTSLVATMLANTLWQCCAFDSLKNLYGDILLRSRASGLWWFVPIANFFMPLICLRDLRTFSRARRESQAACPVWPVAHHHGNPAAAAVAHERPFVHQPSDFQSSPRQRLPGKHGVSAGLHGHRPEHQHRPRRDLQFPPAAAPAPALER
jgi:hypothetical protein